MANNWNYNDFQNWFCEKFKKPNPLPWQDAMGALIDYITNEIPNNIQVVLNKLTSGASSATLTGNGTPLEPFVLTINLSMVDFKGEKGDTGATGPTGPQGPQGATGAGIDTLDQIDLTAVSSMTYDTTNGWQVVYTAVLDYGNGDTHTATATARLPIKSGDNVTIDVAEDGKSLIIKAAGGGSSGSSVHKYKCNCQRSDNKRYIGFFWNTQTDTTDTTTLALEIANALRQSQNIGIVATDESDVYVVRAKYSGGPQLTIGGNTPTDLTLSIDKLY